MAACLIDITGTSGKVYLRYKESGVDKGVIIGIGSFFLDDSVVSNIIYSTLEGDAIASSSCFSIVPKSLNYYSFSWDNFNIENYKFVSFEFDGNSHAITPVEFPRNFYDLVDSINNANVPEFKVVEGVKTKEFVSQTSTIVVRALTNDFPFLKIANHDNTVFIYIKGQSASYPNVGYESFNTCLNNI